MSEVASSNLVMYCDVLCLNQNPNLKVITVKADVVNWVRLEKKDYNNGAAFPLIGKISLTLMFREIKIETIQREVFDYMFSPCGSIIGLYMGKKRFWLHFLLAPWKQKSHLLVTGHWKLFKRTLQKLIHLDFSIRSLN